MAPRSFRGVRGPAAVTVRAHLLPPTVADGSSLSVAGSAGQSGAAVIGVVTRWPAHAGAAAGRQRLVEIGQLTDEFTDNDSVVVATVLGLGAAAHSLVILGHVWITSFAGLAGSRGPQPVRKSTGTDRQRPQTTASVGVSSSQVTAGFRGR